MFEESGHGQTEEISKENASINVKEDM